MVILNTVEVTDLPDVAQAAQEDLDDSHERLREVLEWVEGVVMTAPRSPSTANDPPWATKGPLRGPGSGLAGCGPERWLAS